MIHDCDIYIHVCCQHNTSDKLTFQIKDKFGKLRLICEGAFLYQLGYIRGRDASTANSMWRAVKRYHFGGMSNVDILLEAKRMDGRKKSAKLMDAELFIRKIMQLYGDTLPTAEGTNEEGNPVYVVPYETVKSFFVEYKFDAELNRTDPSSIARYTTFRKAFKSLSKEIRLLGCKGKIYMFFIMFQLINYTRISFNIHLLNIYFRKLANL
jgi:hypothetical protein